MDPALQIEALPVAVFATDAEGTVVSANRAAVDLVGEVPPHRRLVEVARLAGEHGRLLASGECPVDRSLADGRPVRGLVLSVGRRDGSRIAVHATTSLLRDAEGRLQGVVVMLSEIAEAREAEFDRERLASIVSSSNDAIISKTLQGTITSWNDAAERIFGYTAEDMIGTPVLRLIPPELQHEEDIILGKLARGERIEHFDTTRITRDGRRLAVSLTVSPLRNRAGEIIGASKIARDVTERKLAEMLQTRLFDELNHRVKNMLALIQSIAAAALRQPGDPAEFVAGLNGRLRALGIAHDLLVAGKMQGADLHALVRGQLGPEAAARAELAGPQTTVDPRVAIPLALALHELASNARRHGALSAPGGVVRVDWQAMACDGSALEIDWRETGGPRIAAVPGDRLGAQMMRRSIASIGGQLALDYRSEGLVARVELPLPRDEAQSAAAPVEAPGPGQPALRVLVVEDEALIAMDLQAQLAGAGFAVIGPAGTIEEAMQLIGAHTLDAALVDANVRGRPVGEIAAALTERGVPFAFATGYGRSALPASFQAAPILAKPFGPDEVLAMIGQLTSGEAGVAAGSG